MAYPFLTHPGVYLVGFISACGADLLAVAGQAASLVPLLVSASASSMRNTHQVWLWSQGWRTGSKTPPQAHR
jgi:hypothetical protein